jgi:hypothetical protein
MINRVFLYPFIQSHWSCFESLVPAFIGQGWKVFVLDDGLQAHWSWKDLEVKNEEVMPVLGREEIVNYQIGVQDILLVGNDSDGPTVKWIEYFRNCGATTVMLQDGWLVSKNILRPIYRTPNLPMKCRWWLHYFLVRYTSFGKKRFHNFLCQNADLFFVYSEYSKNELVRAGVDDERIRITGSPKHQMLALADQHESAEHWILFTTISYSEQDLEDTIKSIEYILSLEECAKLLVKLHPDEEKSKYMRLTHPKLEYVDGTFAEVMHRHRISFAFCFASTVVLDLLKMNTPVIQLAINGMERRYSNYFFDLSMVRDLESMEQEIKGYNLLEMKTRGQKYLLDLRDDFDSRREALNIIKQLGR